MVRGLLWVRGRLAGSGERGVTGTHNSLGFMHNSEWVSSRDRASTECCNGYAQQCLVYAQQ